MKELEALKSLIDEHYQEDGNRSFEERRIVKAAERLIARLKVCNMGDVSWKRGYIGGGFYTVYPISEMGDPLTHLSGKRGRLYFIPDEE